MAGTQHRTPEKTGQEKLPRAKHLPICHPVLDEEERKAVLTVLESGFLTEGKAVSRLEERFACYVGTQHAVAFMNGTVALHAMLLAAGVGPGDEVIVPSFTFISTASSVLHAGARPVFADIEPRAFTLDPEDVARRITPRTKAVMPVHYAGQSADLVPLRDLCEQHGLVLLEDAAEAHGCRYEGRMVGSFGQSAMFSFTPTKLITSGEGGVVTTDSVDVARKLRRLKNHGREDEYHHVEIGYNYRMTELQAAIGDAQLSRLESLVEVRRRNAHALSRCIRQLGTTIGTPFERPGDRHVYMMYTIRIPEGTLDLDRDEVCDWLGLRGIQTKFYFPPIHTQPAFLKLGYRDSLPITEQAAREVLSLPIHPGLEPQDIERVAEALEELVRRHGR